MFGAAELKRNFIYNGYGVAFDGTSCWSFSSLFAPNVVIFSIPNSFLRYSKNLKNDFLILGHVPSDDNSDNVGESGKNFSINFTNSKANFRLSLTLIYLGF